MLEENNTKELKILLVYFFFSVAMVADIIFKITTDSIALFTNGIHMAFHVLSISLRSFSCVSSLIAFKLLI